MNPELLAYLLANCSADIHLHCGPEGRAVAAPAYPWDHHHGHPSCPQPCPEVDYSNPNQPYFWDHEEMN